MEADSTTFDNSSKDFTKEPILPFTTFPDDLKLYKELVSNNGDKSMESQIVEKLQRLGLIPSGVKCPTGQENCRVISKTARVIDRVQWMCEGCGKKLPIRTGSFFLRIQCSILQIMQMILAWSQDADCESAALHFGVKPRVATTIYDKLDELVVKEQMKCRLGGDSTVVITEMYPDCLMRLSPDTTDQPHVHRILMIADTKLVPTRYHLHVIKEDFKKNSRADSQTLTKEVQEVICRVTERNSTLVTGTNVPPVDGACSMQQLMRHCDIEMQHFLTSGIWRQALTLCAASRELCVCATPACAGATTACAGATPAYAGASLACAGATPAYAGASPACALAAQRYLLTALYRLQRGDGFYAHVLTLLATDHTDRANR